jgi:hypothetical protein
MAIKNTTPYNDGYHCPVCNNTIVLEGRIPASIDIKLGEWLNNLMDDPTVCNEMKEDISMWFASFIRGGHANVH